MGNLLKICRLRWSVYAVNAILACVTVAIFLVFQYAKNFFSMYSAVQLVFSVFQWLCICLIIGLIFIVFTQYQKAGTYHFYENGVLDAKANTFIYYHDVMTYHFMPQSNNKAYGLTFETDESQVVTLSSLLDKEAFILFQQGHARVWGDFVLKQLDAKRIISFDVDEDVTSFKMQVIAEDTADEISCSHEGIVCYGKYYPWEQLLRYEVSWTGMLTIKNKDLATIFMEPIVNIERYYIFMYVLDKMIGESN